MHKSDDVNSLSQAHKMTEEMFFVLEWHSVRDEWELWATKAKLLAEEAIPLMNGIDPRSWQEYKNGEKGLPDEMVQSIKRCLELAKHEELIACMPSEWLDWGLIHSLDKPVLRSEPWVQQPDVCMWPLFESAVNKYKASQTQNAENIENEAYDYDEELAQLFDPVSHQVLSAMFPSKNKKGNDCWLQWHRKAKECGLAIARQTRGKYNPYLAAKWWLDKYKPEDWNWARCLRVLANKCLPARSIDHKDRLTGYQ